MENYLLFLLLMLMGENGLCQQEKGCSKSMVNSCGDCMRSAPECVWCKQLNFTKAGEQEAVRCDTKAQLMKRGCEREEIISPENTLAIVKAESSKVGLDAMMQAAVCGERIGWRNSSTRLIVLTTDAGFHMAGDGKLAGILEPNDEQCHIENSLYTKSNVMDYPSVGQLAVQLEKNNIQPIFAVTKNVEDVYKQLTKLIPKSEDAYKRLSSKVTVTHDNLPEHWERRFILTSHCSEGSIGQFCECLIGEKDELTLRASCQRNNGTECEGRGDCVWWQVASATPQRVEVVYYGDFCECDDEHCEKFQNKLCGGNGKCNCGRCDCFSGFEGSACQCKVSEEGCRTLNNTVCYNRGTCKCNRCECKDGYQHPRCHKCLGCPDPLPDQTELH
ncbi:hypothetical protein KUCAC02_017964 [Chaenocephalus aceratus]|uniref:Uncharacterized protein n=1 Tax=Chaenocephalus aceratus TaxID=36190 RepID=A0ACB9W7S9_CHAAC|nr:hypothetical protein KUCAC02_017964 [Chaenocephalus aceratus]